ncbi:hypothetical protein JTE90_015306 [Oedothorax gibbosus]|uniref:Peptidase A2 domain-containing protein n=1 Tax=Oedothorax gibbosus TaxID=931172 RepID=A0AAV6VNG0_9ARAC|nr:hypothetical protein JTE90_015306 [Oedothorax gibbosus]
MEIDTGCAVSLINQHTYRKLGAPALRPADTALSTFTGQSILVLGTISSNARTLPFAVRDKVKDELQRLQDVGIIKPVRYSQWAAPIVPVLKIDKTSIRICGDFKLTANVAIDPDQYPLPRAEDIFASLAGGVQFSKLDLTEAYIQPTRAGRGE